MNAYCTLATRPNFIQGAKNLYYSWKYLGCKNDFFIMVTDNLYQTHKEELKDLPIRIVPYLKFKDDAMYWYEDTINKFYAWTFTEYEKIMFLDADMVILNNPDKFFDFLENQIAGFTTLANGNVPRDHVAGECFIIHPDKALATKLLAELDFKTDEWVLDKYFSISVLERIQDKLDQTHEGINKYIAHMSGKIKYWELFNPKFNWEVFIKYIVSMPNAKKKEFSNLMYMVSEVCQNRLGKSLFKE